MRDELYYLLGRYHYTKGELQGRDRALRGCARKIEFYPKAKFLEGITSMSRE